MRIPLLKYYLLTFFSACFFFTVFHTVAEAHAPTAPLSPSIADAAFSDESVLFIPTPTSINTPTPTIAVMPTDTPSAAPRFPSIVTSENLETLFSKYGTEYGVDANWLKKIAKCESNFNPNADSGLYVGMFQFAAPTWSSTRTGMGFDPNPDLRRNAEESIRTAAYMLSHGRQNAWPNCH
jgi:hypothetical protein